MYLILVILFIIFCGLGTNFGAFPGINVKRLNDAQMVEDQDRSMERCRYFWKKRSSAARHARSITQEKVITLDEVISNIYGESRELNAQNITINNTRRLNYKPEGIWLPQPDPVPTTTVEAPMEAWTWHKDWKGAVIPYYVDSNSYDASMTEHIKRAFEYVAHVTCIRLELLRERPADISEFPWVHISNPDGVHQCVHSNHLKKNVGRQWVVLGYECLTVGEIAHEVMHLLGFGHEHARPDRDAYVTIIWDNIKPGYKKYFEISDTIFMNMAYDFTSVMHYPARAFTKNGKITVLSKQGNVIGQRQGFSELDLQKIKTIYDEQCTIRNDIYLQEVCPKVMEGFSIDKSSSSSDEYIGTDYYEDRIWKYGLVQYSFKNAEDFAPVEKGAIRSVMEHISSETCIQFTEAAMAGSTSSRRHAARQIQLEYGGEGPCLCPSVQKGIRILILTRSCFNSLNDLLHILVHSLGFEHQHLAHDRDQYVVISWNNMDTAVRAQMEMTLPKSASLGFRYDYDSIMHMPWMQYINGKQVVMYPVWNYGWNMGHWRGLSEIDVAKINRLYGDECRSRDVASNEITEEQAQARGIS